MDTLTSEHPHANAEDATPSPSVPAPSQPGQPNQPPLDLVHLFETHESELLHYAHGFVHRRSLAEDLVQDAFLRLHRVLGEGQNIHQPRAWLYRCLRNLCLNHLRKHKRETLDILPEAARDVHDDATPPEHAPDAHLLHAEALSLVRDMMSDLEPSDQRLLHLKYHEDQSYQRIADELDIGVGNVGYRLHHLLKHLALGLAKAGYASRRSPATPTKESK